MIDLQYLLDAYYAAFPHLRSGHDLYFFFDEIHEVEGWERFIRRLLDKERVQIYLTGSSAKLLAKEIHTCLRGRTLVTEVYPYSFREYLTHFEIGVPEAFSMKDRALIRHHLYDYMSHGGFPELVDKEECHHREILQSYIDTVIYRDIIDRYQIRNPDILRKLLVHGLQNPASRLSINKTHRMFKSLGYSVGKDSLYAYMDYFEDVYCLFSVPMFHLSVNKSRLNPRKIYPIDQGLITAYTIERNHQLGPTLETMVFSALKRVTSELFYFATEKGFEVDFLGFFPDQSRGLYQVSLSLLDPKTQEREFKALDHAMAETELREATIVTLDETEEVKRPNGTIHVIPLLDFLCSDLHRR